MQQQSSNYIYLFLAIPVMEFQVWGYKISKALGYKWMSLKETSVPFQMEWGHGLKNDTFWLSTSDSKCIKEFLENVY